jgi:putative DNA methylase
MTTAEHTATPRAGALPTAPGSWAHFPAFMEVQFPVSKVSKESYNERKAVAGQTLTALGKWWGRKPLVLVRATILGLLLPATDDPKADRETFLALMTMDDEGMLRRLDGNLPAATVYQHSTAAERLQYFDLEGAKSKWKKATVPGERARLQRLALLRMGYDERLKHCKRPEEIDGPSPEAWAKVNAHLGTSASSLPELVRELGERRFGHTPRVADAFCGGGSIPFEAARIGCEAYGSDLNPVAALLTWGALNIVGGGREVVERVQAAQRRVYEAVRRQVEEWCIERNEEGWTADAYLYCVEVRDPATGWMVPLSPSWVVAEKNNVIVRLVPDPQRRRFDFEVVENASPDEFARARPQRGPGNTVIPGEETWRGGVVCPVDREGHWLPPAQRVVTGIEQVRGRDGLRLWENDDLVPRPGDALQERLYCIRWVDGDGNRHYRAPTGADLQREEKVLALLRERFADWQGKGFIPSRRIEPGDKTEEPIRTRGWTHWHHLFNPRQLLVNGLFADVAADAGREPDVGGALLLLQGRLANWNSKLSQWKVDQSGGLGGGKQTFYNQAINPMVNYSTRTLSTIWSSFVIDFRFSRVNLSSQIDVSDARVVDFEANIWITDPGYADSINYGELSEFFLAWYEKRLPPTTWSWWPRRCSFASRPTPTPPRSRARSPRSTHRLGVMPMFVQW